MSHGMGTNPYDSPKAGGLSSAAAADKVSAPAIALIIFACLGIALCILGLLLNLLGVGLGAAGAGAGGDDAAGMQAMMQGTFGIIQSLIGLVVGVVILLGALKMKKLESYGFALTSAILAMIPVVSPCCCIGLPIGIWAVVVLNDAAVKAAFR